MNLTQLTLWLAQAPAVLDWHGHPIARPESFPPVVAQVVLEHPEMDDRLLASTLDQLAAHEGSYNARAQGDCPGLRAGDTHCTVSLGAKSCGAYQTPCTQTKLGDLLSQTRLAARHVVTSFLGCPEKPLNLYASGQCPRAVGIAETYLALIRKAAARPVVEDGGS